MVRSSCVALEACGTQRCGGLDRPPLLQRTHHAVVGDTEPPRERHFVPD